MNISRRTFAKEGHVAGWLDGVIHQLELFGFQQRVATSSSSSSSFFFFFSVSSLPSVSSWR